MLATVRGDTTLHNAAAAAKWVDCSTSRHLLLPIQILLIKHAPRFCCTLLQIMTHAPEPSLHHLPRLHRPASAIASEHGPSPNTHETTRRRTRQHAESASSPWQALVYAPMDPWKTVCGLDNHQPRVRLRCEIALRIRRGVAVRALS